MDFVLFRFVSCALKVQVWSTGATPRQQESRGPTPKTPNFLWLFLFQYLSLVFLYLVFLSIFFDSFSMALKCNCFAVMVFCNLSWHTGCSFVGHIPLARQVRSKFIQSRWEFEVLLQCKPANFCNSWRLVLPCLWPVSLSTLTLKGMRPENPVRILAICAGLLDLPRATQKHTATYWYCHIVL